MTARAWVVGKQPYPLHGLSVHLDTPRPCAKFVAKLAVIAKLGLRYVRV